jgi:hypothetical protein
MKRILLSIFLPTLLLPVPLAAEIQADSAIEAAIDAGFSDVERQIIEEYYGKRPRSGGTPTEPEKEPGGKKKGAGKNKGKDGDLPPGLAKRDELPPGLAKREVLPPGLAKRSLPDDLEKQLPPPPKGYRREIIDEVDYAVIVLVHEATGVVSDLIKDVVIPHGKD